MERDESQTPDAPLLEAPDAQTPTRQTPARPGRRRFLTQLVAAPVLTVAARLGIDDAPAAEAKAIPSLPSATDLADLGDVLILAGSLTAMHLVLEITPDNRVSLLLPRAEVGQGMTTTAAMIVAEELDARLTDIDVPLSPANPGLLFNQLTGSSNSVRSLWHPLRSVAASARARLITAASRLWDLPAHTLSTRDTQVFAPDGRSASYGSLSAAAAGILIPAVFPRKKSPSTYRVIGHPTGRIDARDIVTGKAAYAMDLEVPGAMPAVIARAPTINGTLSSYDDSSARTMPGVLAVVRVPSGVAVVAETFDQAFKARDALRIQWTPGPLAELSDEDIRARLIRALPKRLPPPLLLSTVDADFDFAFVSHAPLETLAAVADVRADRAEVWCSAQSPIVAQQAIAFQLGLPMEKVTLNVIRGGGSFGRRLFFDAALEAAHVSKAAGRPVKLLWTRNDDMRHGRMRPASHHRVRATFALGQVISYMHHAVVVRTDLRHGAGEALTALGFAVAPTVASQAFYLLTQKIPYHYGIAGNQLTEVPLDMHTGSWRGVFSGMTGVVHEVMTDEIARRMNRDPVAFRREFLSSRKARAVLEKVVEAGQWGRALPPGHAQGVAIWEEFNSAVAYLVEIDALDPAAPRVTRAVAAADVGRAINPRGLQAQLMGSLVDGLSITLQAGLHIDRGAVREGSYADFRYARMRHAPLQFEAHILPPNGEPGGAGELGVPAAAAAVANAYARATGTAVRSFPIAG